jgi:hypothetical protein
MLLVRARMLSGDSVGVKLDLSVDVSRSSQLSDNADGQGAVDSAAQLLSLIQASTQDPATRSALWMPVVQTACGSGCSNITLDDALLITAAVTPTAAAEEEAVGLGAIVGSAVAGFAVALVIAGIAWHFHYKDSPKQALAQRPQQRQQFAKQAYAPYGAHAVQLTGMQLKQTPSASHLQYGQQNPLYLQPHRASVASYMPARIPTVPAAAHGHAYGLDRYAVGGSAGHAVHAGAHGSTPSRVLRSHASIRNVFMPSQHVSADL